MNVATMNSRSWKQFQFFLVEIHVCPIILEMKLTKWDGKFSSKYVNFTQ